jgi:hypothetical protein
MAFNAIISNIHNLLSIHIFFSLHDVSKKCTGSKLKKWTEKGGRGLILATQMEILAQ